MYWRDDAFMSAIFACIARKNVTVEILISPSSDEVDVEGTRPALIERVPETSRRPRKMSLPVLD